MGSQPDTRQMWRAFLVEVAFARNYPLANQLSTVIGRRNPVLERILPSLLYIKMAALLDEALIAHMDANGVALGKNYKTDLYGRISTYADKGKLPNGNDLHEVRNKRNDVGHESQLFVSWDELEYGIDIVQLALSHLGLAGARPEFEVKAERSAARNSDEPGISWFHDYSIAVLDGEKLAGEITWRENLHNDEAN